MGGGRAGGCNLGPVARCPFMEMKDPAQGLNPTSGLSAAGPEEGERGERGRSSPTPYPGAWVGGGARAGFGLGAPRARVPPTCSRGKGLVREKWPQEIPRTRTFFWGGGSAGDKVLPPPSPRLERVQKTTGGESCPSSWSWREELGMKKKL